MPFVLVATVQDVVLRAKEFAALGATDLGAEEIALALADAAAYVNTTIFGGPTSQKTVLAQVYVAAHLLSIRNPALAQPAGAVISEQIGQIKASYAVPTSVRAYTEADWNQTRWGREYMTLYRGCAGIKFVVAGKAPPCPVEVIE
jgi:hypothetical protein